MEDLNLNYKLILEKSPGPYLILDTNFIIVAVNDVFLNVSLSKRENIIGKYIFEMFPDPPDDPHADGVKNLKHSLEKVLQTGLQDTMPIQKYDIRDSEGHFIVRYWDPVNYPVMENGRVKFIIHHVQDVTNLIELQQRTVKDEAKLVKLREQALESNTRMKMILNSTSDAFITINSKGEILDWNKAAETTFGRRSEEVIGKRIDQIIIPERLRERHINGLLHFLATGEGPIIGRRLEMPALRRDGTEFMVELSVNVAEIEGEVIFGAFLKDISERISRDIITNIQLSITRTLIESSGIADIFLEAIKIISYGFHWKWGGFWKFDKKSYELQLHSQFSIDNTISREGRSLKFGEGIAGKSWEVKDTIWIKELDSNYLEMGLKNAIAFPIYFDQNFCGVIEFLHDEEMNINQEALNMLTDLGVRLGFYEQKKVSHEQLRFSEERFRLMVSSVKDYAIFMLDTDGTIITWNEGATWLSGYDKNEIIGKNVSIFYTIDDRKKGKPEKHLEKATKFSRLEDEGMRVKKNGELFYANSIMARINDDKGNIIGFSEIIRDLTQIKDAQEALHNSYQVLERKVEERTSDLGAALNSRDEFLLIASHELKTPITSLKLRLQQAHRNIIKQDRPIPDREQLNKIFHQSLNQVESLTILVEDLLDVSKIQTGRFELHFAPFDISLLFTEVIDRFKEQFAEAKCETKLFIEKDLIGNWDSYRLEQVIVNLISNAIKYAPNSLIEFHLYLKNSRVHLVIKDHGPGVPKDKQQTIFERFERLSSYQHVGGLGLGLFIVKKIVEAHHGDVYVESEHDAGAAFIVELPINQS